MVKYYVWLLVFFLSVTSMFGAEIVKKNGEVLEGKVEDIQLNKYVRFRAADGRLYQIKWEEIDQLNGQSLGGEKDTRSDEIHEKNNKTWSSSNQNMGISFSGGLGFPLRPEVFSKYWNTGFNVGLGLEIPFHKNFSFLADIEYGYFSLNSSKFLSENPFYISNYYYGYLPVTSITGGDISLLCLAGGLKFSFLPDSESISPYLNLNFGFSNFTRGQTTYRSAADSVQNASTSSSNPVFLIGGGVDFPVSDTGKFFIDERYGVVFTQGTNTEFLPLRGGFKFRM